MIELVVQISKNGVVCSENGLIPWIFPKVIGRIFQEDIQDKNIIKGTSCNLNYEGSNKILTVSRRKRNLDNIIRQGGIVIGGYITFHTFYPYADRVIYYVVNSTLKGEVFIPYLRDVPLRISNDYIEDIDQVSKKEFYIARIEYRI